MSAVAEQLRALGVGAGDLRFVGSRRGQEAALLAGHVPQVGECVDHPSGWKLEITDADERRINRLRLHPPVVPVEDDD